MMITDSRCFRIPKDKKQVLCSEILISKLLSNLYEKEIINYETYQNAIRECASSALEI